ncbi:MAG TPA: SDR family NAD(P)-dependent oxidoreductase [Stellaceae bacterium]|jgi:acyl transferase domain-containing protein/NAD(P)-dependent dehydrogenase (short-subunit alcohol dehydrogenase family)/acyl-CoA thioesterase FadM|nr:SDR family NAD(P)-dependent oxidoreductase [Stellaceae bacterium]
MSRFYAITYPIRFTDTMAYGSHHFLTNFRFQCEVRESLFFDYLGRQYPGSLAEYDDLVILTRDGYSRNLAPAMLGERVAVLLSLAQPTRSSVQLCIRTINGKGEPVACGFQTLVFMDRQGSMAPFPRALDAFSGINLELGERLVVPSFATCAISGGSQLGAIFSAEICALGQQIVRDGRDGGCIVNLPRPPATVPVPTGETVFSFPGQNSFDLSLFRDLCRDSEAQDMLAGAEPLVRETLGTSLHRLVNGSDAESAALLASCPDLDQFGIILSELLLARRLTAQGFVPAALIGHSFGEIAALCVGGCITPDVAMRIVAERVRALRQLAGPPGGMLALSVPLARAEKALAELDVGSTVCVSVINNPSQTVLSGPRAELEALVPAFAERRIGARVLASRYAYHSPGLASTARALVMGILDLPFGPPTTPVYSPILGRFYDESDTFQIALSSHLTQPVDFPKALDALVSSGMTRIVECGAGGVLTGIVKRNSLKTVEAVSAVDLMSDQSEKKAQSAPKQPLSRQRPKAITPEPAAREPAALEPIAIVSMGCVLPGADDPDHLWRNLLDGTSGILDLRTLDKQLEDDLIGGTQAAVRGDKSYSALAGYAADIAWRAEFPFGTDEFDGFSKAQRLLVEALRQAKLAGGDPTDALRTLCLLGSTADGIAEYDDALLAAGARQSLDGLNLPAALHAATRSALDTLTRPTDPEACGPFPAYSAIVRRMLDARVQTILLDAACASSLYALDLGVQALRSHEADLAYVGGVFAPGPSSSALFAQFGGLSTTGSHALDQRADGVVFGEGAAILGLRRLSDAIARGETIHAVVTASALASDGHSVAVNVPRAEGQIKAMKAAYQASGIDHHSVQYVEAHATATPVGDATEFKALNTVFGDRAPSLPRIKLGSVKSLLGHTGWLAGTTSVIKVVQSLKHGVLPPHHGWRAPGPGIELAASPFEILTSQVPWPAQPGTPRRAAINGFGFGGTNAHVIIEDFTPGSHDAAASAPSSGADIVCVGFGAAFTGDAEALADRTDGRSGNVNLAAFRMPRSKLLMPDALEQMDTGQFTVLTGADRALASSGIDLPTWKERIGIVIGSAGKARRGVAASQRILADRLCRKLETELVEAGQEAKTATAVSDALATQLKAAVKPCNAYTLVGMMPNLVAGRVGNVFDLMGPSLVVDTGPQSLLAAIRVARSYLHHGMCDAVLTGGVNATAPWPRAALPAGDDGNEPDGAAVLMLMRRETALAHSLPILAMVVTGDDALTITPPASGDAIGEVVRAAVSTGRPHEVGGIAALASCMQGVVEGGPAYCFRWSADLPEPAAKADRYRHPAAEAAGYKRDERPIAFYERIPVPVPVDAGSAELPRRILLVTDQPKLADILGKMPGFEGSQIRPMVPDPADNEELVVDIAPEDVDLLLIARDLRGVPPNALLALDTEQTAVLNLTFLAVRHLHERIADGRIPLLSLHLNAWPADTLHPDAAIIHGLLKSLAREWPDAVVRSLATDSSDLAVGAATLEREMALAVSGARSEFPDVEIVELGGRRHALRFAPTALPRADEELALDADSVVVLTGGARGVTAVMAEALIERYGCRLVLLGRSDPEAVPPALRSMSVDEMERYETEYYRSERQRDPKRTIPALKRDFIRLKAAHETWVTTESLRRLGRVEFKIGDITVPQQVDAVIRDVVERHGSVDLVVHGAGLQISKRLANRQLSEFRQVVGTKLDGLRNLVAACTKHVGPNVPVHILTSAFSAMGNDGQPDYGAANEAMAALACVHDGPGRWTALGWLGWAAVGMTRGSEYAALGNSRGLRAVLPEEGKALFLRMMEAKSRSPAVSLLSDGEIQFYQLPIVRDNLPASPPRRNSGGEPPNKAVPGKITIEFPLSLETAPYLNDHLVNGSAALPGTFEVEFALRAAQALCPNHPYFAARNPQFHRFVRIPERGTCLRAEARLIEENADGCVIGIRLISDFVHRSGVVLQRDVVHFEGEVLTSAKPFPLSALPVPGIASLANGGSAEPCSDPYLSPGSPVKLGGMFACLHDIRVGPRVRVARYHIDPAKSLDPLSGFLSPVLLLDALFRLVGVAPDGDVSAGAVSVPLSGDSFHFAAGLTDRALQGVSLKMVAANPRSEGEYLRTDWGHVTDPEGRTVVSIAGAFARRMGAPAGVLSVS